MQDTRVSGLVLDFDCLGGALDKFDACMAPSDTMFLRHFCSLYNNNLGEKTGIALGKALETNTSLQTLM